ncbi:hypothetical protein [Cupriavidus taiwanensis]|uniref:Uncharacterized protein n=1 Tax=Cupriavidus taiwanensis TaxID=164546 RepID=A0A375J1E4_9BURK|nr:hypothetical protein [Cupriavidus taiwanensis]SPR98589.1 hypothetical protein CBM2634_A290004 [Cupriavidus taiwanensis]
MFEQNAVGLVGPLLREHWGVSAAEIGFLNTLTAPETFGRALDGADDEPGEASRHPAGQPAASQHS